MEKEFIPYEQALELKHLGFEYISTIFAYDQSRKLYTRDGIPHDFNIRGLLSAPLYQQAFRWFREKHGLIGYIQTSYITHEVVNNRNIPCTPRIEFTFGITNTIGKSIFSSFKQGSFKTYEEAELEGHKKLIENFKQK